MYLWLLDEYKKLPSGHVFKESPKAQFKFIRRAELIIAFVMRIEYPKELAVIGSTYTGDNVNEVSEKGFYDIALGADQHKDTVKGSVYWDYSSGALGQYYAGSLYLLNLMETRNGYFERTEDYGKELAEAYRKSMSSSDATILFLKRIEEGKLYAEDLVILKEIALNHDYKGTVEGEFYRRMLLSNDGILNKTASNTITYQRKESLQLFLSLIKDEEGIDWNDLPRYCYNDCLQKNKTEVTNANFGWYYYYLNELAHHSLEAVFWGLLVEMDGHSYSLQQFLSVVAEKVEEESVEILKNKNDSTLSELIQNLSQDDFDTKELIDGVDDSVKANNSYEGILRGVLSLICLYRDNKHKLQELQEYASEHFLDSKHGNALAIFKDYIENSMNLSFKEFVNKLIHTLLNEHIAVAYAKMGNGEKNLLKFVLEDNYLIHIETMTPNFTNPRLKTLYNFTRDLGLVGENDLLTSNGEALLNEINNGL